MTQLTENFIESSLVDTIKESLNKGIFYQEYRDLVNQLALENKASGIQQSEELADYTLLNNKRMKRLDKTLKLSDANIEKIREIDKKITFLALTESWCGDAAQTLPVINKIAEMNTNINFKVVFRDENLALMNHFLTNGALSIPKLIMLDKDLNIMSDWGPRPKEATEIVEKFKKENGSLTAEFKQDLQMWYTKDKGESTANDILSRLFLE